MKLRTLCALVILLIVFVNRGWAPPPITAFTYQGRLTDAGSPANGLYDFRLGIFNDETQGDIVGLRTDQLAVLVSNGLFTVLCDPGEGVFDGSPRWLQISVRTNGGSLVNLTPRQLVGGTPHALFSLQAVTAWNLNGSLPAQQIGGVLAESQLPASVARLTGVQSFAGPVGIGKSNATTALDVNGTVAASQFQGRGAMPWQAVSGVTQQAIPNQGYVTTDTRLVTITLPPAPNFGDVIRISGAGPGGWRIAQNPGQSILTSILGGFGANWVASETNRWWTAVATSASGSNLVAVASADAIFTSADAGVTWTARETARAWTAVASSADGRKLIAAVGGGQLYTSTDFGATWTPRETNRNWRAVVSTADGVNLFAASYGDDLYVSTNSGTSWTPLGLSGIQVNALALTPTGTHLYCAYDNSFMGSVILSTNAGISWIGNHMNGYFRSVACSAEGNRVVAVGTNTSINLSSDSMAFTTEQETRRRWAAVASSADGARLVAADFGPALLGVGGHLYVSTDYGLTWTPRESARNWTSVAASADGQRLVAVAGNGQIYTSSEASTLPGNRGYLGGGLGTAVELQYLGNGLFLPISHEGALDFK